MMKIPRVLYLGACFLLFISCASPVKSYHKAMAAAPFDVIIVPGIPYQDRDWTSNIMKDRVAWSVYLYKKGIAVNVIYSGNAVYSPYIEGRIMAMYAIASGIPGQHVFSETKAEHSTENLIYSYRMATKMGFEKIAVATDPNQSTGLKTYAWDYGIPVVFIPILYDSLRSFPIDYTIKIDPSAAFISDFVPLPQRENIIKRVMGTLGFGIRTAEPE
ncbi:MAG: YdcF family protein [Bacteroidetes bacterium]|nr:YdcF family protein [Bacteroidota bacterium]